MTQPQSEPTRTLGHWTTHPLTMVVVPAVFAVLGIIAGPWAQGLFSKEPPEQIISDLKERLEETHNKLKQTKESYSKLQTEHQETLAALSEMKKSIAATPADPEIVSLAGKQVYFVADDRIGISLLSAEGGWATLKFGSINSSDSLTLRAGDERTIKVDDGLSCRVRLRDAGAEPVVIVSCSPPK